MHDDRPPAGRSADRGPLVVGVTGGIASGKSVVARELAGEDGVLVDADREAHAVLASPEVAELVRARFGGDALDADGRPLRGVLAERVFSDPEARAELESWIHPRVRDRIHAALAHAGSAPVVVLDVPLLLENDDAHGLARACDVLVHVDAPLVEREARAQRDRGWPPGEVARRERTQIAQDEKRSRADVVLANDGDLSDLREAARRLRRRLLDRPARRT
ncbi:MAG: dephospho-CoA kinase [Planctomycetota bacterium]